MRVWTSVVLSLLLVPGTARGQEARQHRGFWISFGPGLGLNLYDVHWRDDRVPGKALYIRLGGSPTQQLLLGVEAIYWGSDDLDRGNTTLTILYYPKATGGLFLRGGVGTSNIELDQGRFGFGTTWGAGLDVRLGENFYLTPNLDWLLLLFDPSEVDPAFGDVRGSSSQLLLTVGVTWH